MDTSTLSCHVSATGADLHLVVRLDDAVIYDGNPDATGCTISHDFADLDDQNHVLSFEMSGKLPEHTILNDQGSIIQDRMIEITDLEFDGIALGYLFHELAVYHHDTNGTTDPIQDRFFGAMGCNGRVEIQFKTPIYLWLLENM